MAWTAPASWTLGQTPTFSDFNTQISNNMAMTSPALVTTKGDIVSTTGAANTPVRKGVGANGTLLSALSTTDSGLAWGAWIGRTIIAVNLNNTSRALGTTSYSGPGYFGADATENIVFNVVPFAGTIKNLRVLPAAGVTSTGGSTVFTVRKGGVDTSIVATLAAGTTSDGATTFTDTSNTATFAAGDTLSLEIVNNSTSAATVNLLSWSVEMTAALTT